MSVMMPDAGDERHDGDWIAEVIRYGDTASAVVCSVLRRGDRIGVHGRSPSDLSLDEARELAEFLTAMTH